MASQGLDLDQLVRYFASCDPSGRNDSTRRHAHKACLDLFERDYNISLIGNANGDLCSNYPLDIIVLESEKRPGASPKVNDPEVLKPLFHAGRFARTRSRFAVPVILHRGTNICRSATLARKVEIQCREGGAFLGRVLGRGSSQAESMGDSFYGDLGGSQMTASVRSSDESVTARHRQLDIDLLHGLGVQYICDLMIEERKVKYGLQLTSSEKADTKGRYQDFNIAVVPYPGVEWFKGLGEGLRNVQFDWAAHPDVNVELKLPPEQPLPEIHWPDYKSWSLITLTQNYLRLFLAYLRDDKHDDKGLLIHCISGWDRTPLFISLLRMSLWADGEIHQSLNADELLYLTIAYDWLGFGHLLRDRLDRGEEIFLFCFDFLQNITGAEYSFDPESEVATAKVEVVPRSRDSSFCCFDDAGSDSQPRSVSSPVAIPQRTIGLCSDSSISGSWQMISQSLSSNSLSEMRLGLGADPSMLAMSAHSPPDLGHPLRFRLGAGQNEFGSDDGRGPESAFARGNRGVDSDDEDDEVQEEEDEIGVAHRAARTLLSATGAANGRVLTDRRVVFAAEAETFAPATGSDSEHEDVFLMDGAKHDAESALSGYNGSDSGLDTGATNTPCLSPSLGKAAVRRMTKREQRLLQLRDKFIPCYCRCLQLKNSESWWASFLNLVGAAPATAATTATTATTATAASAASAQRTG